MGGAGKLPKLGVAVFNSESSRSFPSTRVGGVEGVNFKMFKWPEIGVEFGGLGLAEYESSIHYAV